MSSNRTKIYVLSGIAFVVVGLTLAWHKGWIFSDSESTNESNQKPLEKKNDNSNPKTNDTPKDTPNDKTKDTPNDKTKDTPNDKTKAYEFYKEERKDIGILSKQHFEHVLIALETVCKVVDKFGKKSFMDFLKNEDTEEDQEIFEQFVEKIKDFSQDLFRSEDKYEPYLKKGSALFNFEVKDDKIKIDPSKTGYINTSTALIKNVEKEAKQFVSKDMENIIYEKNIGEGPRYSLLNLMTVRLVVYIAISAADECLKNN